VVANIALKPKDCEDKWSDAKQKCLFRFQVLLQHTATHCNTHVQKYEDRRKAEMSVLLPDHTATHCNKLQHTATHCNTLQHTATHCNTLQRTLVISGASPSRIFGSAFRSHCNTLQHTATHCNTLQHTATHCNTLQHTVTHCDTLQHRLVKTD